MSVHVIVPSLFPKDMRMSLTFRPSISKPMLMVQGQAGSFWKYAPQVHDPLSFRADWERVWPNIDTLLTLGRII